jgi:hypothetical protein
MQARDIAPSLEAVLAGGMMEEHVCAASPHASTIHHKSRVVLHPYLVTDCQCPYVVVPLTNIGI